MTDLESVAETDRRHSQAAGIARGAGVLAGLTMLARILGLVRTLVFSQAVGATCLGTAYYTANQVPNLVYELVLGGTMASVMVPVLARSAERSAADPEAKAEVAQISSALLSWTVVILVPLTLIVVVAAGPIAALLNPLNPSAQCVHSQLVATTASMLRVFAPQALLYGLSVVLFGLLQAYRRFAGYALAPFIASLVLIASYFAFASMNKNLPLGRTPMSAQLVLSGGATLGIAAMVVVGLVPTWRLRLRFRPTLRFPPGVARRTSGLIMVGLAEMVVQEISGIAVIALANGRGETGALVIIGYASQVFYSLNAVLALSIILSAFPVLSARDGAVFDRTCAGSTRAVVLMSCLGIAVTGAITVPAAHVLAKTPGQVSQLMLGFALLAPGLIGVGVIANLTRALMALGRLKVAGIYLAGSGLLMLVAQVVLAEIVPPRLVVGAITLGNTIGATGAAIPLVIATRRIRGKAAVQGTGRATLAGLAAAVVGTAVGVAVSIAVPVHHRLLYGLVGAVAAVCAVVAFGVAAYFLDDGDLRVVAARLRQIAGMPSPQASVEYEGAQGLRLMIARSAELSSLLLQRIYDQTLRRRRTTQVWETNREVQHDSLQANGVVSPAPLLTRREQQCAIGIGVLTGAAGGYAVFATSNQAGTFMLLLISLVFLLLGLAGTPLLRWVRKPAAAEQARHARRGLDDTHAEQSGSLMEGVSVTGPSLVPRNDADGFLYQSDWPGDDNGLV